MIDFTVSVVEGKRFVALFADMIDLIFAAKDQIAHTEVVVKAETVFAGSAYSSGIIRKMSATFYCFLASTSVSEKVYINEKIPDAQLMHIPRLSVSKHPMMLNYWHFPLIRKRPVGHLKQDPSPALLAQHSWVASMSISQRPLG